MMLINEIKRADSKSLIKMMHTLTMGRGKRSMPGTPPDQGAKLREVDINAGTRNLRAFDNLEKTATEEDNQ